MSIILTSVSVAVLLITTTAETISLLIDRCDNGRLSDPIPTRFNNGNLLMKTIAEHGIVSTYGEDGTITAYCGEGILVYKPDGADGSYTVRVNDAFDVNLLASELNDIEIEYDANVQSYTYSHIMENLPGNMSVEEEEVLEDDSILITLAVY